MLIGAFLGFAGLPIFVQMMLTQEGAARYVIAALVVFLSAMGPAAALLARAGHGTAAGIWLTAIPSVGAVIAVHASRQLGAAPFFCGTGLVIALATLEGRALRFALGGVVACVVAMASVQLRPDLVPSVPSHVLLGSVVALLLMAAIAFMHARAFRRTLEDVAAQQARAAHLEARYRLIAENTMDLVALVDPSDTIVYASPSFERVLGSAAVGDAAARALADEAEAASLTALFTLARSGEVVRTEVRRRRVDGTAGRFECMLSTVAGTNLTLCVARDVTAERAMAADLEHAKKMEALGRFAGSIAHDFNNLLSVMRTCATLASQAVPRDSSAQAELNDVQDAISRASNLTSQLLAFSRRDVVVPVRLELVPSLARASELAQRLVGEGVKVELDVPRDAWPVWCGPGQLDQVVMNLAANARDAMPGGGTFRLAARNVPGTPVGDAVLLTLSDTGTGLSPKARSHLFEPFFTTKAPGIGTGLGLPTVFGVVKALGGLIEVSSELGRGTEFRILFPRAQQGLAAPAPALSPPRRQRRPGESTVLVVDDDADVRSLMVRIIAAEGFQVLSASDAEEALALSLSLSELPVLVTDVMLPGKDGSWLAQRLTERFPSLRVVLVSGFAARPQDAARLVAGGARFVQKPFRPIELTGMVRECLGMPPPAEDALAFTESRSPRAESRGAPSPGHDRVLDSARTDRDAEVSGRGD